VGEELATIRREIEAALRDRIALGIENGAVAGWTEPTVLAAYVMTVIQGFPPWHATEPVA
jgi:hypothetical protein